MRTSTRLGLLLLLSLANAAAFAGEPYVNLERRLTPEQLRATGLDTLTPAQLALLNRLLSDESAEAAKVEAANIEAAKAEAVRAAAPVAGAESSAQAVRPREGAEPRRSFIGLEEGPVKSRLKGSVSGWEEGTVFELENGQIWKVLKGSLKLRKTLDAPEVLVVPGIMGRWFLQVDEDMPKARVYRID